VIRIEQPGRFRIDMDSSFDKQAWRNIIDEGLWHAFELMKHIATTGEQNDGKCRLGNNAWPYPELRMFPCTESPRSLMNNNRG